MQTLQSTIDQYNAAKRESMPAEVLETMARTTSELKDSGIENQVLRAGDRIPDFSLPNQHGEMRRFADYLAESPVVLNIYRGGWCPYCNFEMKALADALPEIEAAGARLIGMSPETPEHARDTAAQNNIGIEILSDAGNVVSEKMGLVFSLAEELRPIYLGAGLDIPAYNGDDTFLLPVPATYIVGSDGIIKFDFVNADYTQRLEPQDIVAILKEI
ncbi:MAG: peroxiredoxin-like family protein [Gammaproteobacteria bacterium]